MPHIPESVVCLCLRWNGFFPHHLTQQQQGAFSAPCRVMISISNRLSVLFFRSSFRGEWMVAEWPWSWMLAPKWYSNMRQQLIGGLTLMFGAEEFYYLQLSTDLLFLSSLFLQWKLLFLYIWWLVSSLRGHWGGSCRKLWSNTVATNYCKHYSQCSSHSELSVMRAYFPGREGWRGSKESALILSPVKNADAEHFSAASVH